MLTLFNEMIEWIHLYYGNGTYLVLSVFAYLFLFCTSKELRNRFLLPILLFLFLLSNPLLYKYIYRSMRYWRWFWAIPNTFLIACALVRMARKLQKPLVKYFLVMLFLLSIVFVGDFVYSSEAFIKTQNVFKMDYEVIEVCSILLNNETNPKCITCFPLINQVRQYSGDIRLYYGRSVTGGYIIPSTDEQISVYEEIMSPSPNYRYVLDAAIENDVHFIIIVNDKPIDDELLREYHYDLVGQTARYLVYHFTGK